MILIDLDPATTSDEDIIAAYLELGITEPVAKAYLSQLRSTNSDFDGD